MNYLFLYLFMVLAALHLAFCFWQEERVRKFTKPFLIPMLIGFYLSNAGRPEATVLLAMVCGWVGDVLLLGGKRSWFMAGLAAFLAGHLMYILALGMSLARIEHHILWPVVCAYAVIGTAGFWALRNGLGKLKIPVLVYIVFLTLMSLLAFHRLWFDWGIGTVAVFIGTLFFCLSDFLLGRRVFIQPPRHPHLMVMLTYLAAQFLIVYGLI